MMKDFEARRFQNAASLTSRCVMLNRREFLRHVSAAGAASALPWPLLLQAVPAKKISYAAVGLGRISMDHFMPGTRMGQLGTMTGLVSGHPDKAHKVAAQYGIAESAIYTYENFDSIRDNPNIDAVYIALPNSMHAEYTIRAAQAGKHVLCEKPMATSVADAQAMIAACKKANRKLMVAYRCHLQPSHMQARELVRSGALGKIEAVEGAAGFNQTLGEWRLNAKLAGGGPLMDIGVYALNACRFILGEEPMHLQAYRSVIDHDGRFNEVEENLSWTMKFPSGALASMTTTYGANMPGFIRLHGSKGMLEINGFAYDGISLKTHLNGTPEQTQADDRKDPAQFVDESDYFSRCLLTNTEPGPNGDEGLRDIAIMMQLYDSAAKAG
jgi:predicted dehydrogenase